VSDDFRIDSFEEELVVAREEQREPMAVSLAVNRAEDLQEWTAQERRGLVFALAICYDLLRE
jgi:hypothetical protein